MSGPLLQFPFVNGLNESHDPKTLPPGSVTTLVNAMWTKDGRLDKRPGTALLAGTGAPTSARRFILRKGELCITDGSALYSHSASAGTWTNVGALPEVGVLTQPLLSPSDGIQASDSALLDNGLLVHAWVAGNPIAALAVQALYFEVLDPATGVRTTVQTRLLASTAKRVRVVTDGTNYVILGNDGATNVVAFVNGSTTPNALKTDTRSGTPIDACVIGSTFVIAYEKSSGTNRIILASFSFAATPVNLATVAVAGETTTTFSGISIDGASGEVLYVAYCWAYNGSTSQVKLAMADPSTLTQTTSPIILDPTAFSQWIAVGVARIDASHCVVAYSTAGTVTEHLNGFVGTRVVSSTGTLAAIGGTHGVRLLSRPFMLSGKAYALMADEPSLGASFGISAATAFPGTSTYLAGLDITSANAQRKPSRYLGLVNVLQAGAWLGGQLSNVVLVSSTEAIGFVPFQEIAPQTALVFAQGVQMVGVTVGDAIGDNLFSATPSDHGGSVEVGGEAYIACPVLMAHDGRRPFDFGFPVSFWSPFSTSVATSAGAMVAGNYIYSVVSEFRSAAGILHRSPGAPTYVLAVGGSTTSKVTLWQVGQYLGWKGVANSAALESMRVLHATHRSEVGGSVLHRLTVDPSYNATYNDAFTAANNSLVDTSSDASISGHSITLASRPVIYNAVEADDWPPACPTTVHVHKNRVWTVAGDRRTVQFSKDFTANPGTAPGFHPSAVLIFDEPILGLSSLDDKLMVFSAKSIWYVIGEGPAPNGDGSDYSPTKIQTDVGCMNPRSLVSTPGGIMFESESMLYMLSRTLEVSWIGQMAQDTLAAFPAITSAVLLPASNQVRFTCNDAWASPTAGVALVYDYLRNQWATFHYYDTVASAASTPIADACIFGGVWTFVTPGGSVFQEDASTYLDGGSHWVSEDIELADVCADGPVGYQRMRKVALLGDRYTDCDVRLRVGINSAASYDQDHTWTSTVLADVASVNLQMTLKTQKSRAMRLRISDAPPTGLGAVIGTGRGVSLSALALEIQPLTGTERRAAKAAA